MLIPRYMQLLDGPRPLEALELLEPDLEFLLALPSGEVRGRSREEYRAYIDGRAAPPDREHRILRRATDRDLETVYGQVVEAGRLIGSFVSIGLVSPAGLLARYQSFFHAEFGMYPPA